MVILNFMIINLYMVEKASKLKFSIKTLKHLLLLLQVNYRQTNIHIKDYQKKTILKNYFPDVSTHF